MVITGGEPLQVSGLEELADAACGAWARVEVETAGVRPPPLSRPNLFWNWSPKLPSVTPTWEDTWRHRDEWMKEPVVGKGDRADVVRLAGALPKERVWLMPEGMTEEALKAGAGEVAELCKAHGWRMSPRLHVWLWGPRRGV
jgi:7-carboxy-7-deazaguanine synthase